MDAASLQLLTQCVRLKAAAVRQWADTPDGNPAARSGNTLSRLLLSNQRILDKAAGNAKRPSLSDDSDFPMK